VAEGNDLKSAIGRRLVEAREAEGLDQRQMAAALGMSPSALCKIEKGQRGLDSLVLYRAAEMLGRPMSDFFPPSEDDSQLMLARRGIADDGAMSEMAEWSARVLSDLDFMQKELERG
jgi:transcriptional regulator with XRE-family HTH domain